MAEFWKENLPFLLMVAGAIFFILVVYGIYNLRYRRKFPNPKESPSPKVKPLRPKQEEPSVQVSPENQNKETTFPESTIELEEETLPLSQPEPVEEETNPMEEEYHELSQETHSDEEGVEEFSGEPDPIKKDLGRYHIIYRKDDGMWIIKREGSHRVLRVLHTQKEAIAYATIKAITQDTTYVIHKKDGKIRRQNY